VQIRLSSGVGAVRSGMARPACTGLLAPWGSAAVVSVPRAGRRLLANDGYCLLPGIQARLEYEAKAPRGTPSGSPPARTGWRPFQI
jgi:hypothetical protein